MNYRAMLLASLMPIALVPAQTAFAQSAAAPASSEAARLTALFARSDEDSLKRNPIQGLFRGDLRYADQFGDYITDAYFAAERKATEAELAELKTIDRAKLDPTNQLAYDVFKYTQEQALRGLQPDMLALTAVPRSTISSASTPFTRPFRAARTAHRSTRSRTMTTR